jgi:hypothetical protein
MLGGSPPNYTAQREFQFVSVHELHRTKYSLPARQDGKIPNKHGPSHAAQNL